MIRVHVLDGQGYTLALFECTERARCDRVRRQLFGHDAYAIVNDDDRGRCWRATMDGLQLRFEDLTRQEALF